MTQLINIEEQRRDEILEEAAGKKIPLVLSRRTDSGWVTYKSRFLHADTASQMLVIEQPVYQPGQAPPELVSGEQIGLSFRRGHKKIMCSVNITRLARFGLNDGTQVSAVEIPWPDKLQEMQRRLYYRSDVPRGRRIEVQMWDGGAMGIDPLALRQRPRHVGLLQDLSAGGCRVVIDASRDPQLEEGDTVGLQFQPDPRLEPICVDGMFRHVEHLGPNKIALGFQFVGLEMTPQGRQMLQAISRVVSTFLRIEIRRSNMRLQRPQRRR